MLIISVNNGNFIDLNAYITLSYDNQCSGIVYILLIVILTYTKLGTGECFHESNPQSCSVRPLVADMESRFDGSYHVIIRKP